MKRLTSIIGYFQRVWCFWRWIALKFYNEGCLTRASALTYTSLLSLVPLMVVVFSVFSAFPVFSDLTTEVQTFVFSNFIPSRGNMIQQYVTQFAQQAGHLPLVGFIFLAVTAILMMLSVENALNELWKVKYRRQLSGSILLYWAMLTLGPFLLGIGVLLSSYLGSLHFWQGAHLIGEHQGLWVVPSICEFLAFTFLYIAVPHCPVRLHHAAAGALISTVLFEIAKKCFGYYILYFPTYTLVYGALATIPIFLLWVYFSWVIFLFGAIVVNGLRLDQAQRSVRYTPYFVLGYRVLGHLWNAQKQERALTLQVLLKLEAHCSVEAMQLVLLKLKQLGYIFETKDSAYVLSCDLYTLTLLDLYRTCEWFLPEQIAMQSADSWQQNLAERVSDFSKHNQETLKIPLIKLFS